MSKILAGMAALALPLQGQAVVACTYIPISRIGPEPIPVPDVSMREPCRLAVKNPKRYLKSIGKGEIAQADALKATAAMAVGHRGCRKNSKMAFRIADALIAKPISTSVDYTALGYFVRLAPSKFDQAQLKKATAMYWLLGSGVPETPPGFTKEETQEFLSDPLHWHTAVHRFSDHGERDQFVFAAATNPQSAKFDLGHAARLGSRTKDKAKQLQIAKLLVDPRYGPPRFEEAAKLLDWYSPYFDIGLTSRETEDTKAIWTRIAQNMLGSKDTGIKARGNAILAAVYPHAQPQSLPDLPNLTMLGGWPDQLPAQRNVAQVVSPNDYPRRSLQNEEAGPVELSLLFNPDGTFSKFWVTRSSGYDRLDQAVLRAFGRRFRPRTQHMQLDGYHGQHVLVPLTTVVWRLESFENKQPERSEYIDGKLIVTSRVIDSRPMC